MKHRRPKRRLRAALTMTAAGAVPFLGAAAASAATTDVVYGNTAETPFVFKQTTGDCEEGAVDVVYGAIRGHRMKESTVIREAQKLRVMGIDPALGSTWFGPDGVTKLLGHYGLAATVGAHSIATIEADLKAGDHVIAFVNADTIWAAAAADGTFPAPPAGYVWNFVPGASPDHSLVIDEIDATKGVAYLSDTGPGVTETVPLIALRAALAASGYSVAVVTTK